MKVVYSDIKNKAKINHKKSIFVFQLSIQTIATI